jgi:hypothetical protein
VMKKFDKDLNTFLKSEGVLKLQTVVNLGLEMVNINVLPADRFIDLRRFIIMAISTET